jgi:hypothetical protein
MEGHSQKDPIAGACFHNDDDDGDEDDGGSDGE